EKKLSKLSVEELQALYTEVVGRSSGSSDRRYVELTDMMSYSLPAARSPRESAKFAPHIHEPADGRMTLRFPRADACMPTSASAGSRRSEVERSGPRAMRLPELQQKYVEVVGEPTRSPNKALLVRKIL